MLSIRKTKKWDVIRELDAELFGEEVEGYGSEIETPEYIWWLVKVDGELAGFCGLKVLKEGGTPYGYLCRSGLRKKYRGKGIQKALIKIRDREAKRLGLAMNLTYTARSNYASANNLIKCGYTLYPPDWAYGLKNALYFWKHFK